MLADFVGKGVTPREATFMKKYLTRSHAFDVDTAAKRLHQALDVDLLTLPADYYDKYTDHVSAVTPEAANLKKYLDDKKEISMAEFRDLAKTSRKFAVPIMEYFDSQKLTQRVGDKRVLRG